MTSSFGQLYVVRALLLRCTSSNDTLVKFWSRARPGDGRKREREEGDEEFDDEVEMRMLALRQ
jgi:hypothetical protein